MLKFLKSLSVGDWLTCALVALAVVLTVDLKLTEGHLSAEREKTSRLEATVALTGDQLRQQNAGIEALSRQRDEDRRAYVAGIKAADKQAVRLEIDAADILKMPSPATPETQCVAAESLLRKELTQ